MPLTEEARRTEERMLQHVRPMTDVPTLKRTLHEGLSTFEALIANLPAAERNEIQALYLEKVRRVTFGFHVALLEQQTRRKFLRTDSPIDRRALLNTHRRQLDKTCRLYRFI